MLAGPRILLRSWREGDVPFFHALRNDLATQLMLVADPRPHTLEQARGWLDARAAQPDGVFFVIAAGPAAEAVGFAELRSIQPVHGWATLGLCLAAESRGNGYAAETLDLLERYAHNVLGVRKMVLQVLASHSRARKLYERGGYRHVGIHQAHFRFAGAYHDVLIMEKVLTHREQDALPPWMP